MNDGRYVAQSQSVNSDVWEDVNYWPTYSDAWDFVSRMVIGDPKVAKGRVFDRQSNNSGNALSLRQTNKRIETMSKAEVIDLARQHVITAKAIRKGYVYFVLAPEVGRVKIGYSEKPPYNRMIDLQVGSPVKLELIYSIPGGPLLEKGIHAKFDSYRLHGEWFEYTDSLKDYICEIKKQDGEHLFANARVNFLLNLKSTVPETQQDRIDRSARELYLIVQNCMCGQELTFKDILLTRCPGCNMTLAELKISVEDSQFVLQTLEARRRELGLFVT